MDMLAQGKIMRAYPNQTAYACSNKDRENSSQANWINLLEIFLYGAAESSLKRRLDLTYVFFKSFPQAESILFLFCSDFETKNMRACPKHTGDSFPKHFYMALPKVIEIDVLIFFSRAVIFLNT